MRNLCNLEIGMDAQRNLQIVQIFRLRGTCIHVSTLPGHDCLTVGPDIQKNFLDLGFKSHVQHPVCFIQYLHSYKITWMPHYFSLRHAPSLLKWKMFCRHHFCMRGWLKNVFVATLNGTWNKIKKRFEWQYLLFYQISLGHNVLQWKVRLQKLLWVVLCTVFLHSSIVANQFPWLYFWLQKTLMTST